MFFFWWTYAFILLGYITRNEIPVGHSVGVCLALALDI